MRKKTIYPADQIQWLRENRGKYHYYDLAPAFNQKFGTNFTTPKIYWICDTNGAVSKQSRQTPARTIPDKWIAWLKQKAPEYDSYASLCRDFNAEFHTSYKNGVSFAKLCRRAGIEPEKTRPMVFAEFAETHFDEIRQFCREHWTSMSQKDFTDAFNNAFHVNVKQTILCNWVNKNRARIGVKPRQIHALLPEPTPEEIDLYQQNFSSMHAKEFADLYNSTLNTSYDTRWIERRGAWLADHNYVKESDIRKRKKIHRNRKY